VCVKVVCVRMGEDMYRLLVEMAGPKTLSETVRELLEIAIATLRAAPPPPAGVEEEEGGEEVEVLRGRW